MGMLRFVKESTNKIKETTNKYQTSTQMKTKKDNVISAHFVMSTSFIIIDFYMRR